MLLTIELQLKQNICRHILTVNKIRLFVTNIAYTCHLLLVLIFFKHFYL